MRPGTKKWKMFMAKMYGWGAAVVILGALFKIQHYPGASPMLIIGLGTEAALFIMFAFAPKDPVDAHMADWAKVYPQLATSSLDVDEDEVASLFNIYCFVPFVEGS